MSEIIHAATFSPTDAPGRILNDLACPACGRLDPEDACGRMTNNKIRIFCEGCGAFITILLDDEQAATIDRAGILDGIHR